MNHMPHPAPGRDWIRLLTTAQRLRIATAACRVRFTWLGLEKALTPEQNARAARDLQADPQFLRTAKRLLDVHHPAFRALTSLRGRIESYWRALTLPFPEPGLRLIPLDQVEPFDRQMNAFRMQLREAAIDLQRDSDGLRAEALRQLGPLFDPADYPAELGDAFSCRWDFPSLEPSPNLSWLSPAIHQQEEYRVEARFEQAVRLVERMFFAEFRRRVAHLAECLAGDPAAGSPRVFRAGAVNNLADLLARYRQFDVRTDDRLDELFDIVGRTLGGVTAEGLRHQPGLRRTVAARLAWVQASLAAMAEDPLEGGDRADDPDSSADDA
jgi:hypothetical protein